jgi:tRNA threonylcarbamoyladenosine biosynthesis protein TsaB
MRVLAFDTATAVSSVALLDGERLCFEAVSAQPGRHGEVLLPRIRQALASAGLALGELDLIAVGLGPGSFTGLRVGLATAKGFGLALGVALRGVCSLEVLALAAWGAGRLVVPVMNAQRGEVFCAAYGCVSGGRLEPRVAPFVAAPDAAGERLASVCRDASSVWLTGDGLELYGPRLAVQLPREATLCFDEAVPLGRHLARLGGEGLREHGPHAPAALEPLYLRDGDARLPAIPLDLG